MQAKRVTEQLQIMLYSERVSLILVEMLADWVGSLGSTRALRLRGMDRGDEKLGRRNKRKQYVVNMVRDEVRRAEGVHLIVIWTASSAVCNGRLNLAGKY